MKLIIEITDIQLDIIKRSLRVRKSRAHDLFTAGVTDDSEAADYASRILHARRALDLSMQVDEIIQENGNRAVQ